MSNTSLVLQHEDYLFICQQIVKFAQDGMNEATPIWQEEDSVPLHGKSDLPSIHGATKYCYALSTVVH